MQTNPAWSPDGKYIVFVRQKAYNLKNFYKKGSGQPALLDRKEVQEFLKAEKTFLYDLYRIPFNGGKGGKPEPLEGASNNGMSNYFPKYSPDGKWIVFCKAKSYMLLQPDSELYIIPAEGGRAIRMQCNTNRMNSWHSWSSNSKWLVFASKVYSPYTQLFLTHIDENGNDTPPVLLSHFSAPDRAANIPEFVNIRPGAIKTICEQFLDDTSFTRAAGEFLLGGDNEGAARAYQTTLKLNPMNVEAHNDLGVVFEVLGKVEEAIAHYTEAIRLNPNFAEAHNNLGYAFERQGKLEEAINHYLEALRLNPNYALAHYNLGTILQIQGNQKEAINHYLEALKLNPDFTNAHYNLGNILHRQGKLEEAISHYTKTLKLNPKFASAHNNLGIALERQGKLKDAITHYTEALKLNPNFALAHNNLGIALERQGKLEEAIVQYTEALRINPGFKQAKDNLMRANQKKKEQKLQ